MEVANEMNAYILFFIIALTALPRSGAAQVSEFDPGTTIAEIAAGDRISEIHAVSILQRANINVTVLDSPYRPMFESCGPSKLAVPSDQVDNAIRTLKEFSKSGFILLSNSEVYLPKGYFTTTLGDLVDSQAHSNRSLILFRALAAFVRDVQPRRPMEIVQLALRQRKYLAKVSSSEFSTGFDIIVVARLTSEPRTLVYHAQVLGDKTLTEWLRIKEFGGHKLVGADELP